MRAEQRGTIPFLTLLTVLLLLQAGAQVAFWAASTHFQLTFSFSSATQFLHLLSVC